MRRLPVVLHVVVYKNDWSSAFLPGCACVHLPTMTPRVKPPHTLVSVLHWLWYCRATALSALANLTLLLVKNTLPFPAFGNLNFVSPPHRRAYTSIPKSCPNIKISPSTRFFGVMVGGGDFFLSFFCFISLSFVFAVYTEVVFTHEGERVGDVYVLYTY